MRPDRPCELERVAGCYKAHQTGMPAGKAQRTASEEPGPREPPAVGKTHSTEAQATTARVRTARRARGGPENDEARSTTAEEQQERTTASTPETKPTRTEPLAETTVEATGATGDGKPCREPAKATTAREETSVGWKESYLLVWKRKRTVGR